MFLFRPPIVIYGPKYTVYTFENFYFFPFIVLFICCGVIIFVLFKFIFYPRFSALFLILLAFLWGLLYPLLGQYRQKRESCLPFMLNQDIKSNFLEIDFKARIKDWGNRASPCPFPRLIINSFAKKSKAFSSSKLGRICTQWLFP